MWWLVGLAVAFVIGSLVLGRSCARAITRLDDEDDEVRG